MRVLLLVALSLVAASVSALFALAVVARRGPVAADRELGALVLEAAAQLDLAEQASAVVLHRAWFHAFANEARTGRPLRSARALAEWTRAVRQGHSMALGTAAEKHALAALGIAGEIAAHRRAPRGMR